MSAGRERRPRSGKRGLGEEAHADRDRGLVGQEGRLVQIARRRDQGNHDVIMPYRKPRDGQPPLPRWKQELNTVHRRVRARAEHALAHIKCS